MTNNNPNGLIYPGLESITIKSSVLQMKDIPPLKWPIKDILPAGLSIMYGKPKIGKSLLGLHMCKAISTGSNILGLNSLKGKVLYVTLEDSERRIQHRMKSQCWMGSEDVEFMLYRTFYQTFTSLDGEGGSEFLNFIRENNFDVIMIDTLSKSMHADQMDLNEMNRVLTPFHTYANSRNKAVIYIDHEPKQGNSPYGSVAKQGIADTLWRLYEDEYTYEPRLDITGRDARSETLRIEKDENSGLWSFLGYEKPKPLKHQGAIIKILEEHKELTNQQLSDLLSKVPSVSVDRSNLHGTLKRLTERKILTRSQNGKSPTYSIHQD